MSEPRQSGDFAGKVVLLTGGAGAIARAAGRLFARGGARLALMDTDAAGLEAAAEALAEEAPGTGPPEWVQADVSDVEAVAAAIGALHGRAGRLDVLVNCAGVYRHRAVVEMSAAEWDETLAVNLRGVFAACRAAGRLMAAQEGGGAIVNLSSVSGQRGSALHAHYCASKAGLVGFGRALALELAPRVRVNAVAPGIIDTPMTREMIAERGTQWRGQIPLARFGAAGEVAEAICFLASGRASYINGAVLNVNGGMWMD